MKVAELFIEKLNKISNIDFTEGDIGDSAHLIGLDTADKSSEEIEERLDALVSQYTLGDILRQVGDLKTVFFALGEFGVDIKKQTDDEFLDKLEVVTTFLNTHDYAYITYLSSSELLKLEQVYQALGKRLRDITMENLITVKKFDFGAISSIVTLAQTEVDLLSNFFKGMGIRLDLPVKQFVSVGKIPGLLRNLGYEGSSWLSEKEQKKIVQLLKLFSADTIVNWNSDTGEIIKLVVKEFGVDLTGISNLALKRVFANIKKLKLDTTVSEGSLLAKFEVIKYVSQDLSKLNQYEISKLEQLLGILQLDGRDRVSSKKLLSWFEESGVKFGSDNLDQLNLDKISDLILRLEAVTNKKIGEIDVEQLPLLTRLLSSFSIKDIKDIEIGQLRLISHVIKELLSSIKGNDVYFRDLTEVFEILKIDPYSKDHKVFDRVNQFLQSFDLSIARLSTRDAYQLVSLISSFDVKVGNEFEVGEELKDAISEIIKLVSYKNLLEIDNYEVEKLTLMLSAVGVSRVTKTTKADIVRIKIIIDALNLNIGKSSVYEIKNVVYLLQNVGLKDAESEQGWLSYLISGKEAAFKEKVVMLHDKIKALGYRKIEEFDKIEFGRIEELLASHDKTLNDVTDDELSKLALAYNGLGRDITRDNVDRLVKLSDIATKFELSLFSMSDVCLSNIKWLEDHYKEQNSYFTITYLSEAEVKNLVEVVKGYSDIRSQSFKDDFSKIELLYREIGLGEIINVIDEKQKCLAGIEFFSHSSSKLEKLEDVKDFLAQLGIALKSMTTDYCKNFTQFLRDVDFQIAGKQDKASDTIKEQLVTQVISKCVSNFSNSVDQEIVDGIVTAASNYNKYASCLKAPEKDICNGVEVKEMSDVIGLSQTICANVVNTESEL